MKNKLFLSFAPVVVLAFVFAFSAFNNALAEDTVPSPVLSTDQSDYHPGDTATILGSSFASLQDVVLKVFGSDESDQNYTEQVTNLSADNSGSFSSTYTLDNLYRPF